MMISTKGRYALRVMIDLAGQEQDAFVPLKDIAARQDISLKYLESIMAVLSKGGFVEGLHGKGGGYRLSRHPCEYKAGDILRATEGGSLAPVACLECDAVPCSRAEQCRTLPLWQRLDALISGYLDSVTLADLGAKAILPAQKAQ